MRWTLILVVLVSGLGMSAWSCGGSSYNDRCRSSSGMPQGDMPCYEPPPNSPQRDKEEQKHTPPGNPMPSH